MVGYAGQSNFHSSLPPISKEKSLLIILNSNLLSIYEQLIALYSVQIKEIMLAENMINSSLQALRKSPIVNALSLIHI